MDYIWTTVSTLDFLSEKGGRSMKDDESFVAFVDRTLERRNESSNIHKFFLQRSWHFFESKVQSWISSAISGNHLKELGVYMSRQNPRIIPPSVFTCESLISLGLQTLPSIQLPRHISFPRLKRLELLNFEVRDDNWNEQLFSNFRVLEELILKGLTVSMKFFSISVPTLKVLTVDTGRNEQNGIRNCVLKFDVPSLVSFSYTGYASKEFLCSSLLELVQADLKFDFEEDSEETDGVAISRSDVGDDELAYRPYDGAKSDIDDDELTHL
ncbi:hypothetical protein C5167_035996 [Papaver somniferum]|nr:hypothetical protein C5167_035996 [Papaver somniferum]